MASLPRTASSITSLPKTRKNSFRISPIRSKVKNESGKNRAGSSMNAIRFISLIFLLAPMFFGCASKAKDQAKLHRAYLAGQQATMAQMQQRMQQAPDPQIRILGAVKNPVLIWSDGLTLANALSDAEYEGQTAPSEITIYRSNQVLHVDPQRIL